MRQNRLSMLQENQLVSEYSSCSNDELVKKYKISKTQFRNICKRKKLKTKNISSILSKKKELNELDGICGIYGIVNFSCTKIYIGSSVNIKKRIQAHTRDSMFFTQDDHYVILIEECGEGSLLDRESHYLSLFDKSCYYNQTFQNAIPDYNAIFSKIKEGLKIKNCGCWEYKNIPKAGGYIWVSYNGKIYQSHRISFFANKYYTNSHINHLCRNKKCCNPDHLEETTASKNTEYYHLQRNILERSRLFEHIDFIQKSLVDRKTMSYIANTLGISVSAVSRYVQLMLREGVLFKNETGYYVVTPLASASSP